MRNNETQQDDEAIDWFDKLDQISPFAPIKEFEQALATAPVRVRQDKRYQWYVGFIAGRRQMETRQARAEEDSRHA